MISNQRVILILKSTALRLCPEIAEKLKGQLLALLPVDDRRFHELAYCLIDSLDEGESAEASTSFEIKLEQRWHEMETGTVIGVPADDAFAEMRKKYP